MFKTIMNREKRKQFQEYVEVAFAAVTIAAFVHSRIEKKREERAVIVGD